MWYTVSELRSLLAQYNDNDQLNVNLEQVVRAEDMVAGNPGNFSTIDYGGGNAFFPCGGRASFVEV